MPQNDHSDSPDTLPPAELNPMLNPVLGENMGRWAEVYFRSPPEKRDEAVLELLQELNAKKAHEETAPAPIPARDRVPAPKAAWNPPDELLPCPSCGEKNSADQRFCGMCGASLEADAPAFLPPVEEPVQVASGSSVQNWHSTFLPREETIGEPFLREDARRERYSSDTLSSYDYAPPSSPYRIYVGGALAIIMLTLGYMAWRSAQATSGGSRLSPQAPPPAVASQPAPSPAPNTQPNSSPDNSSGRNSAVAPTEPTTATDKDAGPPREMEKTTSAAIIAKDQSAPKHPQEVATSAGGSEELAMARRYLSGADGQQRNTTEAVDWLWKSVAKRNADATLLLSDIFLRGDGVSKNCDQARVLLDAAASNGNKSAAERLRHLQAFGCE